MCLNNIRRISPDIIYINIKQPKTSVLISQVNWPDVINCPGHFTSSNPVSISSTGEILVLQKKGTYSGHVTLGNLAKEELLW